MNVSSSREASTDHDGEDDWDDAELLDDAEDNDAGELDGGEEVDSAHRHVAQEHVVGLVLGRHEHHQNALHELQPTQPAAGALARQKEIYLFIWNIGTFKMPNR